MTLPLSDAPRLAQAARRTRLLRLGLAAVFAIVPLAALASLPGLSTATASRGSDSMIVLDVSGSVAAQVYPAVEKALRQAVRASGAHAGLLVFSDTAEEVLPPNAPIEEVLRYLRYFSVSTASAWPSANPWQGFSAGTAISKGIAAARVALQGRGRIFVISDFADSAGDLPALRRQLLAVRASRRLQLRLLPISPSPVAPPAFSLMRNVGGARPLDIRGGDERTSFPI
ncbi:MAG: hypothetical protein C5B48_02865, partial [Candidatus Rokuibacteriota bacterium]